MLLLIKGLGFREMGRWVLHEGLFGVVAAEAIGLALIRAVDRAVGLDLLMLCQSFGAEIVELARCGISGRGES